MGTGPMDKEPENKAVLQQTHLDPVRAVAAGPDQPLTKPRQPPSPGCTPYLFGAGQPNCMGLTPRGAFLFLLALAVASWALVVLEVAILGGVSAFGVANAAVFTITLALWPILTGRKAQAGEPVHLCRECGSPRQVPGIRFCLRCGAYPRPAKV